MRKWCKAETSIETISNAEVTTCDKNVLCRERHERVAIRRFRPHILGWVFLLFLRNKRKGKEYRAATKCRYSGILTKVYEKGSFIADDILQAKILSISIYRKSPFLEVLNKTAWLRQNIILFLLFLMACH